MIPARNLMAPPATGRTMFDKLKGYEHGMEPLPQSPYVPGTPEDMMRGMDNLLLFKDQLLRPPVDPDVQQMIPPRRGLMPVSDVSPLAQTLMQAIGRR